MDASRPGRGRLFCYLASLPAVLVLATSALHATRVRPVNLEEMTTHAATIFSGRCVAVEPVDDSGQPGVQVSFEVRRAVKGGRGDRITLRIPGRGLAGLPRFEPGEEVVLFLYGESASGWTSPVGLGQGKFAVLEDKQGTRRALNSLGNAPLFDDLSDRARGRLQAVGWDHGDQARKGIPPGELLDLAAALLGP